MKKLVPIACAVALAASLGFPQDPVPEGTQAPDLEKRVAVLEKQLALTRRELVDTRARVEETVAYLHSQSEAAKAVLETLSSSEEAGFVPGINFRSREILLEGLRNWWGAKDKMLPPAKPARPAPTRAKDRRSPPPPVPPGAGG